ncbi:hypothetical protein BCIN_09g04880 [Botrytis cinerea B05.10]|uniref:DUF6594 domain-containing protein n=1 Tax=Botryotinia fuckeliana (strain B05.10) TaxID=332648 RepID=A0A384JSX7_BOTFB|nr:hypothetical protein BCIN_09g04880 [Botrytis cinerea B05.10]ATZ53696.1 hypothetical protein BCIN_09g04880 [Botrytis cinerea B05.10]
MEPDLEATAEAPRANPAVRFLQQLDNTAKDNEREAVISSQSVQSGGIRRRNTDQYAGAVRESTKSSVDTERTLTQERLRKDNDKPSHKELMENLKKDYIWEDFETGIPKLARFLATHKDFAIFRAFHENHIRILIYKEIELTDIARELRRRDNKDLAALNTAAFYRLKGHLHEQESEGVISEDNESQYDTWTKDTLMSLLETKQMQYDKTLLVYAKINALYRPPKRIYDSVFHWILNNRPLGVKRLNGNEAEEFIYHHNDFISLDNKERDNPFKEVLSSHLFKYPGSPLKQFLKIKGDDQTSYYDEGLQSGLAQILSLIVLTSMLIAPICLLFLLDLSRGLMVLVVLVFTILVYIVVTLGTPASQFEAFVATVAYCAFLVQFLGNLGRGD